MSSPAPTPCSLTNPHPEPRPARPPREIPQDHWWRRWFEEAEDAQLVCRSDAAIVEANPKAIHLLGLSLPPSHSPSLAPLRISHFAPDASEKILALLRRPSGQQQTLPSVILNFERSLHLIADLQFTPLSGGFSLVSIKDASRRWRMESHVTRLIAATDSTPDVIFLTDPDGRITFVNSAFQTVTGYTIEDSLGKTSDFLRAPGQEQKIQEYLDTVRGLSDWQGELLNLGSDGSSYPVESSISPVCDNTGQFLGYVAFERDITPKKRLQEALLLERNFAVSIIQSLDAAVYAMDRRFRITHLNDGWRKLPKQHGFLSLSHPPQKGDSLLDYVEDPQKRGELRSLFETVLSEGKTQEIDSASPAGSYWLVKIAPWFHEGQILGLIYVVNDRSKFHELERQLFQAQKMETIGALAAGVAHDFNNLLLAIQGNVSLILMDPQLPELLRHRLDQIDEASTQAGDITQQLLTFSRVSDETESILDFNQVIRQVGQMAQRSIQSKVIVQILPADIPLPVRLHPTRAQQFLLNLCINAIDAMPQGGHLTLSNSLVRLTPAQAARTRFQAGGDFICCSLTDTGIGIPPEILRKIFDPFFTTKSTGKGTGLGLSIVHSIVSQAHGFIEVESQVGHGATFRVFLPKASEALTDQSKAAPQIIQGSGRILVVDDLELVRDFTSSFLTAAGYEVSTAASAEEALNVLETTPVPFQLLLTDFNMSGKNGQQLIQEVSVRWPHMKLILSSGYLEGPERRALTERYGAQILNKPFHIQEAADLVARTIAGSSAVPALIP